VSTDLATITRGVQLQSIDDVARVSDMFAKSGFFTDAREAAQCGVKIMAGAAWGIDPFTAMVGIHIISNKPSVSAGLMAAAVKGHPKYDYRVRERTAEACRIEFFEGSESLGVSEYTMDMAARAGLNGSATWKKFPEAMLFARAMSSGVRAFTPDVFQASVYTPEELGASVDGDGNVIDIPSRPTPRAPEKPVEASERREPTPVPERVDAATKVQLDGLSAACKEYGVPPKDRVPYFSWFLGRKLGSVNSMTSAEADQVLHRPSSEWEESLAAYGARDLPTDADTMVMGDEEDAA
jgi:hypothetical protein